MSKLKHVLIAVLTDTHTHTLTHLQAARVREVGQNNCAHHVLGIDSRTVVELELIAPLAGRATRQNCQK